MNTDLCERAKDFLKLYSEAIDGLGLCGLMYHTNQEDQDGYLNVASKYMYVYFQAHEWTLNREPTDKFEFYVLHAYYYNTKFIVLLNDEEYKMWLEKLY